MADVANADSALNAGEPAPVKDTTKDSKSESSSDPSWTDVAKTAVATGIQAAIETISHTVHDAVDKAKSAIGLSDTEESDKEGASEGEAAEGEAKEGGDKKSKHRNKKHKKAHAGGEAPAEESGASVTDMVQQAIHAAQSEVAERHPTPLTLANAKQVFSETPKTLESKAVPSTYFPPQPQHLNYDARGRSHLQSKDTYIQMPRANNF